MTSKRSHFASSCFARLDAHLLSRLRANRLTLFTRLLYALRHRSLCWHVTPSGRVVQMDVSVDEGMKRARSRVYAAKMGR